MTLILDMLYLSVESCEDAWGLQGVSKQAIGFIDIAILPA